MRTSAIGMGPEKQVFGESARRRRRFKPVVAKIRGVPRPGLARTGPASLSTWRTAVPLLAAIRPGIVERRQWVAYSPSARPSSALPRVVRRPTPCRSRAMRRGLIGGGAPGTLAVARAAVTAPGVATRGAMIQIYIDDRPWQGSRASTGIQGMPGRTTNTVFRTRGRAGVLQPLRLLDDRGRDNTGSRAALSCAGQDRTTGRLLHITFILRRAGQMIRVISGQDMHRKEQTIYEQTA